MRYGFAVVSVLVGVVACGLQVPANVDKDNDLRRDDEDNCPNVANPDQSDFDGDGDGDACDTCDAGEQLDDEDKDGIPDACDGCVSDSGDADQDGIPDDCDPCVGTGEDEDLDGVPDNCDACVESGADVDGDGKDDACDDCIGSTADVDMDGVEDGCDTCIAIGADGDGDGVVDVCDACDYGPNHDEDGDGVFDGCDNCPAIANPGQENETGSLGSDSVGDACDESESFIVNTEVFDPFTTQNPDWFVHGTGWSIVNDTMRASSPVATYRSLGEVTDTFTVSTIAGQVIGPNFSGSGSFGLFIANNPGGDPVRISCVVEVAGLSTPQLALIIDENTSNEPIPERGGLAPGMTYSIALRVDAGSKTVFCDATPIGGGGKTALSVTFSTQSITWYPGLESTGVTSAFNYFDLLRRL